jgi:hypothetical protein
VDERSAFISLVKDLSLGLLDVLEDRLLLEDLGLKIEHVGVVLCLVGLLGC